MINKIAKTFLLQTRATSALAAIYMLFREDSFLKQSGWFESFRSRLPYDHNKQAVPWYTYAATAFLEDRINRDMLVFEYGSGNSTLWWSQRVSKVISCEHDGKWHQLMKPKMPANVEYLLVELTANGDYAKEILKYRERFDILVIDGRDRVNCAKNSIQALKAGGIIVWDNSDRKEYAEGFDVLTANGFKRLDFAGLGPIKSQGWCTSIFYRPNNCLGI